MLNDSRRLRTPSAAVTEILQRRELLRGRENWGDNLMIKKYFPILLCPLLYLTSTTSDGWGKENSLAEVKFWAYQIQDIITHDPDGWSGNYPVAYWDSRWKDIIIYGNNQNSSPLIDAIAQEAIWYDRDADVDWRSPDGYDDVNESSLVNYYDDYLQLYQNADVPVFDCEYALNYASEAYSKSNNEGYVPYVTRQSLSQLTTTQTPSYVSEPINLLSVENFLYQLDNINLTDIGNTAFDLVIIDYSSDGEESGEFSAAQIDALKHSPGGEKIVISYMSIGEAEDYRFYWNNNWSPGNPPWLDEENPDWEGNYKVEYWDSNWQSIIFQYADRILDAGFDGVYLDLIDAYEYYADQGRTSAAEDMVNFVASIAAHVRTADPDFFIIPQNASELATELPAYLNTVDGIGQEDIYYGYDDDGVATPADITAELETYLNVFKDANKLVMTVDYPFNDEDEPLFDGPTLIKINDAYSKSLANGYIPYCSVRNLNYLTINPGFDPSSVEADNSTPVNSEYKLVQNYPNPFNCETTIQFSVKHSCKVKIKIYDVLGKEVLIVTNNMFSEGLHRIKLNTTELPSGIYFCHIQMGKYQSVKKMVLIR